MSHSKNVTLTWYRLSNITVYSFLTLFDIFDCKKCPVHLVSFIKHHGLFVPYIDDIFIFL